MSFQGIDFYQVEQLLTEEERLVRDTMRAFVDEKVLPIISGCYERGEFPRHLIKEMAELGMFGANLPPEFGGAGVSEVGYGLIMQELERGDSGLRSFVSVQSALCMYPIWAFGSPEQKQRWLPPLAKGQVIGCFGLTEADGGSDPGAMKTRARREGDHYVLNGSKMWITNGNLADLAIVWAKTGEPDAEISGFLVEKFQAQEIKHKLSLRASVTSELIFEDVVVPASNMLPGAKGIKAPLSCLTQARYGIAWGALGAAMACFAEARDFAASRVTFGRPIATRQLVQQKLAQMLGEITKGQLLCLRLGQLKAAGQMKHYQVSLAKRDCVSTALATARLARDILGASGITTEYQSMRHAANLESVYTYEGTNDIHTLILGEYITGERAL